MPSVDWLISPVADINRRLPRFLKYVLLLVFDYVAAAQVIFDHLNYAPIISAREVGVYAALEMGQAGSLEVVVEKDFACVDRSDNENSDAFPNPHAGATC